MIPETSSRYSIFDILRDELEIILKGRDEAAPSPGTCVLFQRLLTAHQAEINLQRSVDWDFFFFFSLSGPLISTSLTTPILWEHPVPTKNQPEVIGY